MNERVRAGVVAVVAAVVAGAAPAGAAWAQPRDGAQRDGATGEVVDLRPRFVVGEAARYTLDIDREESLRAPGQPEQSQQIRQTLRVRLTPTEVTEAGATVEVVYEAMRVNVRVPTGELVFDSEAGADGAGGGGVGGGGGLEAIMRPVVGRPLAVTVSRDGRVTRVTGAEQLAGTESAQYTSAEGLMLLLGPILSARPGSPETAVGTTWTEREPVPASGLGQYVMVIDYTLESATEEEARITIRGRLQPDDRPGAPPALLSVRESSNEGSIVWDRRAGLLRSLTVRQASHLQGNIPRGEVAMRTRSAVEVRRAE